MSVDNVTVSGSEESYKDPAELLKLKVHHYAAAFPMLSDDKLEALAKDIAIPREGRETGQLQAIIINVVDGEDMIIDGRNRLKACQIAGVRALVKYVALTDGEVPDYINSLNNQRRQQSCRELAEAAWRYKAEMLTKGVKLIQKELSRKFGIGTRTLQKWRPGGEEAKQADAKKGNNNNKYPIHWAYRRTAFKFSQLMNYPRLSPEKREELKAMKASIDRMYQEALPKTS